MKSECNVLLISILCAIFVLVAGSASFSGVFDEAYAADSNIITKSIQNSNTGCILSVCQNLQGPQVQTAPIHTINSPGSILIAVSNSVEIEQIQQKSNVGCLLSLCRNTLGLQTQTLPTATVNNVNSILIGVSNSAEVEQEA